MTVDVLNLLKYLSEEKHFQYERLPNTNRVTFHRELKTSKRNPEKQKMSAATADGRVDIPSGDPQADETKRILSDSHKIQLETAAKLFSELHNTHNKGVSGEDSEKLRKELISHMHDHFLSDTGSKTPMTYTLTDENDNPVWHMHIRHPATTDASLRKSGKITHKQFGDLGDHTGDISFVKADDHNNRFGVEVKTLGGYFGGGQRYTEDLPQRQDSPLDEKQSQDIIKQHMADMANRGIRYVVLAKRNDDNSDLLDTKTFSTVESEKDDENNHHLGKIIDNTTRMKVRGRSVSGVVKTLPKSPEAIAVLKTKTEKLLQKLKDQYSSETTDEETKSQLQKSISQYEQLLAHLSDPEQLKQAMKAYAGHIVSGNSDIGIYSQRMQNKFINERDWVSKVFENYPHFGHSVADMFGLIPGY